LGIVTWLLVRKLIARKTENDKTLGSEFFMQLLQTFVLRRKSALARSIYHQNWLT
jgi:hypothetical protein